MALPSDRDSGEVLHCCKRLARHIRSPAVCWRRLGSRGDWAVGVNYQQSGLIRNDKMAGAFGQRWR
jgi:hypothetical protein